MDKNTVKAIVLAMMVMLLYPMIVKKFYPAATLRRRRSPLAKPMTWPIRTATKYRI